MATKTEEQKQGTGPFAAPPFSASDVPLRDDVTEHFYGPGAFRMPSKLVTSGRGFVGCMAFLAPGVDPTGERELWDVEIIVIPRRKCKRICGGVGDYRIDQIYTSGYRPQDWKSPYWQSQEEKPNDTALAPDGPKKTL